jgi:hypothetical protein
MTKIKFGDQHDQSRANYDVASVGGSDTKIEVGKQFDNSTRVATIHDDGRHGTQKLNLILGFACGLILIATILTLVVLIPHPSDRQFQVFCVVLALAAGGFASVLSGMLSVRLNLTKKVAIGATGALAVFVIVYFFVPAMR